MGDDLVFREVTRPAVFHSICCYEDWITPGFVSDAFRVLTDVVMKKCVFFLLFTLV